MTYSKQTRFLTRAGDGPFVDLGHHRAFIKASARATDGSHLLTEMEADPGSEVPPHVHADEDLTFYVIAGLFVFSVGRRTVVAHPGDTVCVRRGTVHGWRCSGDTPGCCLVITVPGERFEAFGNELAQRPDPLDTPDDLKTLAARYHINVFPSSDLAERPKGTL